MITRREFLKYTGLAGAGVAFPGLIRYAGIMGAAQLGVSPVLAQWVDAVPTPGVYTPVGSDPDGNPLYEVVLSQQSQKLHRDLPNTVVWGYGGTYPGGSFVARTGQPFTVRYVNRLPSTHPIASSIDYTLPGLYPGIGEVRTTVHTHGAEISSGSDGVFAGGPPNNLISEWTKPGQTQTFHYPNVQPAATLWYHDHGLGVDRLNVYVGLAGFFLILDDVDDAINIPKAPYDVALVIQDRNFLANGHWDYPTTGVSVAHPIWVPEFFGDTILVNGKIWPFLQVEPRRYRFRLLNGSNARFYNLRMSSGQAFYQIGSEGGLFQTPAQKTSMLIAPGERFEFILDFTHHNGETIFLTNDAAAPYPGGGAVVPPQLMQFRVNKPLTGRDASEIPSFLRPVYRLPEGAAVMTRTIVLQEQDAPFTGVPVNMKLNGKGMMDPPTEFPSRGTIEIWKLINTTNDAHPIHIHLVMFQVLDRRPFDLAYYNATGKIRYTGPPVPPENNEMGWKDTVKAYPNMIVRFITRFSSFTGSYVYHCHILEHEENDMMRPYMVVPSTYFFAEGSCRPGFDPYITIQNPGPDDANVRITYMLGDGTTKVQELVVGLTSRQTVQVSGVLGVGDDVAHDFSAKVETTNGVQVFCERPMYFDKNGWTGGSCAFGALATGLFWYFAEGSVRPNFETYFTIQNPQTTAANCVINYMTGTGVLKQQSITVGAKSRATVNVKGFLGEADDAAHDFSAKVEVTNGKRVVVERSMYFNYKNGWNGGHDVVGARGPAPIWYFAEGSCRPDFDPFFTILNPDPVRDSKVTITYMKGDGTTKTQNLIVTHGSRATVMVKTILGEGDDAAHDFSATVESINDVPIVAERPEYFNYKGKWNGGHCVMGAVTPAKAWYFAEGTCRPNFDPYITILNPNPTVAAKVKVSYQLGNGATPVQDVTVPPASRMTIAVKDFLGEGTSPASDFSAKVECTNGVWVVAERPMYFNYKDVWNGGHCVMGFAD